MPTPRTTNQLSAEVIRNTLQRIVCHTHKTTYEKEIWNDVQIIVREVEKLEGKELTLWQRVWLRWRFGKNWRSIGG